MYQQCTIGILDTDNDPAMTFDESGRSDYYHEYKEAERRLVRTGDKGEELLQV